MSYLVKGRLVFSGAAALVALAAIVFVLSNPARMGELTLFNRASLVNGAVAAALLALFPWLPVFRKRPLAFFGAVLIPALLPAWFYYLLIAPQRAGEGIAAEQLDASLITDRSSNGIVEVGFSYPIFTPNISLTNRELFTRRVNVFFRMTDAAGEVALFRGVREQIPDTGLSVEATTQGMLRDNDDYLFNPLTLPPGQEVEGRVVFIITTIEDGRSFTETFRRARSARLELRDPASSELLLEIPIYGL